MSKPTIRVVDLDSTISDDSWRHWMIVQSLPDTDPQKYYAYHMHCDGDLAINRYIVDESPHDVVFVTGSLFLVGEARPSSYNRSSWPFSGAWS